MRDRCQFTDTAGDPTTVVESLRRERYSRRGEGFNGSVFSV